MDGPPRRAGRMSSINLFRKPVAENDIGRARTQQQTIQPDINRSAALRLDFKLNQRGNASGRLFRQPFEQGAPAAGAVWHLAHDFNGLDICAAGTDGVVVTSYQRS